MTIPEYVIFFIFGLSFLFQMIYYWLVFARLAFYKPKETAQLAQPPVSVVIAARNEYHNLLKNLPLILEQDYPEFEVVVVNHASNDETALYLKELQHKDGRLKVVQIDRELNFFSGKKFPLSLGIKSARHEILLLTDADCTPAGTNWIDSVVGNYSGDTEIILGYGPYKKAKGFVNKLVRYDTFHVAMQYLSFAIAGMPYMGVGRNLSYKRSMFFRNKGFTSHYKIASGDDDLFINQVATKKNTGISVDQAGFMYSEAKESFGAWLIQKQRHLSTGSHYKTKFKILLGMFSITQILFFASLLTLLILWIYPVIVLSVFVLRLFTQILVHKKILDRFADGQLLLFSLLWEVFHMMVIQTVTIISAFRKTTKWK